MMVCTISFMYLNYDHISPTQGIQISGVYLMLNSAKFLKGLTKFILWHIIAKRRYLAFQPYLTQANLM